MFKNLLNTLLLAGCMFCNASFAAFPDDFSGVTWLDPNISTWSQSSSLTISVSSTAMFFPHSKQASWPNTNHSVVGSCCNASVWAFIKRNGQWYASTFEYLRPNTPRKFTSAFDGRHLKRAPFLVGGFDWKPADGEVYGFMVSGFARFNLNDVNIQERSNVFFYEWGVGPSDINGAKNFDEVPRNADGSPGAPVDPPEPEPEVCVAPEPPAPEVNTHLYTGPASGTIEISGSGGDIINFNDLATINVSDDRSLTFAFDDETFSSTVAQNGSFNGTFTFDILGQCLVDITVNGIIAGTSATGSTTGSEACIINGSPYTAVFSGSFNTTSNTAPSYLDERDPLPDPPNPCNAIKIVPILSLLLDE